MTDPNIWITCFSLDENEQEEWLEIVTEGTFPDFDAVLVATMTYCVMHVRQPDHWPPYHLPPVASWMEWDDVKDWKIGILQEFSATSGKSIKGRWLLRLIPPGPDTDAKLLPAPRFVLNGIGSALEMGGET